MSADTILGIDPGTRHVGIAVLHGRRLLYAKVKTFPGAWSQEKLQGMIFFFDSLIRRERITKVAVKIPDALPASLGFTQVVGSLNVLCERYGIKPRYFTFSEVKAWHCKEEKPTVVHLMAAIVRKYPELSPQYRREQDNEEAYYNKAFAAAAAAHMITGKS